MVNSFQSIITQEDNFEDYLKKALLFKIFEPIIVTYSDIETAKKIIKYIAFAYSMESTKITIGGDRAKEKEEIFDELFFQNGTKISPSIYEEVVLLHEMAVVKAEIEFERFKVRDNRRALQAITRQYANDKREAWGSAGAGSTFDNIRLGEVLGV